ncbi:MAG: putative hydroxymethylpyrimidine transporter CytX [Desulfovibrio sp.]|jgi:putative hydroxymethylpyrimidine transporter CytX|nr:putative hydroxymethylpyrimidine transporter CytX [Desulfovibrio sp.]
MTRQRDLPTLNQMLLWFGASVSIAEILTGAMLSPLGMSRGMAAIIIGHCIGAGILFQAGLIGAKSGLSATESFRISFGRQGSYVFSLLNILQLLGWAAVMIISGAKAMDGITMQLAAYRNETLWCLLIGALIACWVLMGLKNIFRANAVVVTALFFAMLALGWTVFSRNGAPFAAPAQDLSFGGAVELNVAMSLSWLPLISDYTRDLKNPTFGTFASVLSYFFGSILMYAIGLGSALYVGATDIGAILAASGLGLVTLFIAVFSTVVSSFLDAHSAGVSAVNIFPTANPKKIGLLVCVVSTTIAILTPMSAYESFLYLIGSVFAPLFAILFVDFYIFGKRATDYALDRGNMLLWLGGFIFYRLLLPYNSALGVTAPVMLLIGAAAFICNRFKEKR